MTRQVSKQDHGTRTSTNNRLQRPASKVLQEGKSREEACFSGRPPYGYFHLVSVKVLVAQSCLTLCDPIDCSPRGSSVHGILQASILEWVASPFSRGYSRTRNQTHISRTAGRLKGIYLMFQLGERRVGEWEKV